MDLDWFVDIIYHGLPFLREVGQGEFNSNHLSRSRPQLRDGHLSIAQLGPQEDPRDENARALFYLRVSIKFWETVSERSL